jgi:hypothetical protein
VEPDPQEEGWTRLKTDLFGTVDRGHCSQGPCVRRDTRQARWWCRPLARALARREARALRHLEGRLPDLAGEAFPRLLSSEEGVLLRTWTAGQPLQLAPPQEAAWFDQARRLLVRFHRAGLTHDDLAKEPNLLVREADGRPAFIDFQLARVAPRRGRLFRTLGREDLRHLLKHKRHYRPESLRPRERAILARPSFPARLWRRTGKPLYLLVTRGLLGWADREGAGDRGAPPTGRPGA